MAVDSLKEKYPELNLITQVAKKEHSDDLNLKESIRKELLKFL